jgi:hypothetical protein
MLDLLTKTETGTEIDTATKRARIDAELRGDPKRSDREIARIVGCDHKTVGSARERLGIAIPLATISPPISPPACPPPPGVVDEPEENHFLPECEDLVIPSQPAIAVYTNRYDQIVIRQEASAYDDEDKFIYVCPQYLDALIVRLRKYLP